MSQEPGLGRWGQSIKAHTFASNLNNLNNPSSPAECGLESQADGPVLALATFPSSLM